MEQTYIERVLKNIKIFSNSFIFQSEIVLKMLKLTKNIHFVQSS